ncbi:cupredoxin domain-containing protein, partial [Candidatus Nitrosotenuis cloacae]|uniref:cupredoxin domain-containing protein n=1 Tax=Candidatus Nitrosotenuis cloacae TaxID=1603555 RepID=UPI0022826E91
CIVHPWMQASFEIVEESGERLAEGATTTDPNSIPVEEMPAEEAPSEAPVETPAEEAPVDEIPSMSTPAMGEEPMSGEILVSIPPGSSTPGCEANSECFIPSDILVSVGSTVTWTNDDTAAHTVTSGTVESGATGQFDSSLFMAGKTFSVTFDTAGQYQYFCMVHPWMVGTVTVE